MDKKYKIYLKENLFNEDNLVQGLFCIKSNNDEITAKIGVSRVFLRAWKLNDDANYGNALAIIGFLMIELMFLSNNVRDYVFLPDKYPQNFQDEKEGFNLLTNSLREQIALLSKSHGD